MGLCSIYCMVFYSCLSWEAWSLVSSRSKYLKLCICPSDDISKQIPIFYLKCFFCQLSWCKISPLYKSYIYMTILSCIIGSTPTFLYFDLYLYSAYAAHYVYIYDRPGKDLRKTWWASIRGLRITQGLHSHHVWLQSMTRRSLSRHIWSSLAHLNLRLL